MVSEGWRMDLQLFAGEKTEPATPRRRQEARKKGQVPRSHELSSAILLLAVFFMLHWLGQTLFENLWAYFQDSLSHNYGELTISRVQEIFLHGALVMLEVLGPIFLAGVVLGMLLNMVQTGFIFQTETLKPDLNRINPATGAKRIFSRHALFELAKATAKLLVVSAAAYSGVKGSFATLLLLGEMSLGEALQTVSELVYKVGVRVGLALLILGIIDYLYQRWEYERGLRMTKQEVKDEFKQTEGDPLIKSRIRQRQRQLAMRRMMQEVPRADVVITNPTHLAVALRYDPATMEAPQVVAKGAGYVAKRIREVAMAHGVTIVENPPLAQALYKSCEVGTPVPVELYQAVAEVLAFVYRLKRRQVMV